MALLSTFSNAQHFSAPKLEDIIAYDKKYRYQAQLKFACEQCYKSKVKCSRDKPACKRCAKTGKKCSYARRKPRQRIYALVAEYEEQLRKKLGVGPTAKINLPDIITYVFEQHPPCLITCDTNLYISAPILEKNNLAWEIFETLTSIHLRKFKKSGPVHFELLFRLLACKAFFKAKSKTAEVQQLEDMVAKVLPVSLEEYYDSVLKFFEKSIQVSPIEFFKYSEEDLMNFRQHKLIISYYLRIPVPEDAPKIETPLMPYIRPLLLSGAPQLFIRLDCTGFQDTTSFFVQANLRFRYLFGYTDHSVKRMLTSGVYGFLPYSIAGIALLASDFQELMKFAQVQCVKGYNFDFKKRPILNETTDTDVISLNVIKSSNPVEYVSKKFKVITILRHLRSFDSMHDEIYYKFYPVDYIGKDLGVNSLNTVINTKK